MDQDKQGRRSAAYSQQGPQLPNYMKQSAVRVAGSRSVSAAGRPAGSSARAETQSGRSGQSGQSGNTKRRRPSRSQKLMHVALSVFGVLLAIVAGVLLLTGGSNEKDTSLDYADSTRKFIKGISIAGVDVGGLPLDEAESAVDKAVYAQQQAVAIVLQRDDKSWTLSSADMGLQANTNEVLAEALAFGRGGLIGPSSEEREMLEAGKEFHVAFTADNEKLNQRLQAIAAEANVAPMEPYLIPTLSDSNKQDFEPVEGKTGLALDVAQTAEIVNTALRTRDYQAVIEPVYTTIEPTTTLAFLKENTKRIASFTTEFPTSSSDETVKNRVFNIQKAADRINCYVVQPGEEWSFNDWVGPRTKATGWKEANGISGGKEYTLQAGGGICQVSTTLYNALLSGNIPVTSRKAHSIPSSYVPKGLDATVDTSGIDLKFKNDTGAPLYVFVYVTPSQESSRRMNITVSLYGKPLPEGVTYKPRSEVTETIPRTEIKYVEDPTIPKGYQLEKIKAHDGFMAKAYLDKYVDGKLEESIYLYEDKYRGNNAEVHIGTGDPLKVQPPAGAVLMPGAQPVQPTEPDIPDIGEGDVGDVAQ